MNKPETKPAGANLAWSLSIALVAAALLAASCSAQTPRITDVTIEEFPDRVELTAHADSPMTYSRVEFPGQLHACGLEIPAVMETSAFHKRGIHKGGVLSARSIQFRSKPPLARLMASCSEAPITTVYELDGGRVLKLVVWHQGSQPLSPPAGASNAVEDAELLHVSDAAQASVARPEPLSEMRLASASRGMPGTAPTRGKAAAQAPEAVLGWAGTAPPEASMRAQRAQQPSIPAEEAPEKAGSELADVQAKSAPVSVAIPARAQMQEKLATRPAAPGARAVAGHPEAAVPETPQGTINSVDQPGQPTQLAGDIGRFAVDAAAWVVREMTAEGQTAAQDPASPTERVAPFKQLSTSAPGATSPAAARAQTKLAPRPAVPGAGARASTGRIKAQEPEHPAVDSSSALPPAGAIEEKVAAAKQEVAFDLDGSAGSGDSLPTIDLDFVDSEIVDVIKAISVQSGANVVAGPEVQGKITLTLTDVTVEEALNYVSRLSGYQFAKVGRAYVVGTPAGIRAISEEGSATPKTSVFSLRHVSADTVMSVLAEQVPGVTVSMGAADGVETVIVSGSEADVALAAEIIEAIDSAPAEATAGWACEVYTTSHADPVDLIRILGELVPGVNAILGPTSAFKGKGSSSGQGTSSLIPSGAPGTSGPAVATPGGAGGAPPPVSGASATSVTTSGSASNMLILTGSHDDLGRAKDVLAKTDVPQRQVLIQVKVTDVSLDDSKDLGFEWSWSSSTITEMIFSPTGAELPDMTVAGADYTPWHFRRTPQAFTVMMDALFSSGEAKLLANPSVAVMNNREASFFIGDKILYPVIAGISQGTTIYNINTEEVGIGIDVMPQIGSDDTITLYIHPYVSSITGYLQTPQGDYPQTSRRETETQIMVKDGETVVIGGLLRDNEIKTLKKFPLLGDLPLLGEIFRHRSSQKTHSEVMIMITCEIIGE
jgi:type II secretory pathway component GspD/PulD (secretin)